MTPASRRRPSLLVRRRFAPLALALAAQAPVPPAASLPPRPAYADLADLTLAAPVIADATIRSIARVQQPAPSGRQRFYVEADVTALVRGPAGLPPRVGYLLDVQPDERGHLPILKKQPFLLFARTTATAGQLQLVAPDAQLPAEPATDATVRGIARAALAPDAPPQLTGVRNAFYVPGSLPGESETQIFLQTADSRPVSLSVLRRPGERPRWAVALSEIVDDAAAPPTRDTLLWYRLACSLPPTLPATSTANLSAADAKAARGDYGFVLAQLGACGRRRG